MLNLLGEAIRANRVNRGSTQDKFGLMFEISGPAVFKFEKGYVRPSLDLWLKMAADFKIPEKTAVLMWLKTRLPEKYQGLLVIKDAEEAETPGTTAGKDTIDYTKFASRTKMREAALHGSNLPKGLREFLSDGEVWNIYKPTGEEINFLRDNFGQIGGGSVAAYLNALRAMRAFKTAT